ncbi:MAG: hypothetical protein WCX61_05485 [Candidatus Peribacteraceae bacterium]|jgi:hypothetical protein
MDHPRVSVINNEIIFQALQPVLGNDVEHLLDREQWDRAKEYAWIFACDTAGAMSSVGLNPIVCIQDYRDMTQELLTELLTGNSPDCNTPRLLASWIDCPSDPFGATRRWQRMHEVFFHSQSNRVSRKVPMETLPESVEKTLHIQEKLLERSRLRCEPIALSTHLDRWLKHHGLKKYVKRLRRPQ